ncbi:MAG: hypothetical protein C4530_13200 [Desulfobacteraceae bacterium]|nr:MAG: hypothetical protein C4530_13200 [Desulfobacteraceae bacterium]
MAEQLDQFLAGKACDIVQTAARTAGDVFADLTEMDVAGWLILQYISGLGHFLTKRLVCFLVYF